MNLSIVDDLSTAHTDIECCQQRAEYLHILGARKVLELCVGPSLKDLETEYRKFGIDVTGNDVEERWKDLYPEGKWVIGNCMEVDLSPYDTIIFAPPLSVGCTGKREDSLSIFEVEPKYKEFYGRLSNIGIQPRIFVMTLPGRTLSNKFDREMFYKLKAMLLVNDEDYKVELMPLKKKVTKYYDLVFYKEKI
jgi:hypothetical protein